MTLAIRFAGPKDAAAVAGLIDAMDRHYHGADRVAADRPTVAMVARAIAEQEGTRFALALDGEEPVGVACVAVVRPGHALQGLVYLKDLFVTETARGRGIGEELIRFLARFARQNGIGRIDLTTEPPNTGAQRFYERLGAARPPKIAYRFDGAALAKLARGHGEASED